MAEVCYTLPGCYSLRLFISVDLGIALTPPGDGLYGGSTLYPSRSDTLHVYPLARTWGSRFLAILNSTCNSVHQPQLSYHAIPFRGSAGPGEASAVLLLSNSI